jgi:hypothetical protein
MMPQDRLAILPLEHDCGTQSATLQIGFEANPASPKASASFTTKDFALGVAILPQTGSFASVSVLMAATLSG